ncbi:MAG: hypothetical protein KDC24_15255, partial [Saprospiraceae bacterium]|nr:hypothetical protein [Saprospiraceae bacterium]
SVFVQQDQYPNGLYLWLNIPIINFFAWIYFLLYFKNDQAEENPKVDWSEKFSTQKARFLEAKRNKQWKLVVIVLALLGFLFQPNMFKNPIWDFKYHTIELVIILLIIGLTVWFLQKRKSYIPLMILLGIGMSLVPETNFDFYMIIPIETYFLSVIILFGMFHFDALLPEDDDTQAESSVSLERDEA